MLWSTMLRDGDIGRLRAAGAWIVALGAVPHADSFFCTANGEPWIAHEWLSEQLTMRFRAGGLGVLILLFGLALATLYAQVARHLWR